MRPLRLFVPRGILHKTNFEMRTFVFQTLFVARLSEEVRRRRLTTAAENMNSNPNLWGKNKARHTGHKTTSSLRSSWNPAPNIIWSTDIPAQNKLICTGLRGARNERRGSPTKIAQIYFAAQLSYPTQVHGIG